MKTRNNTYPKFASLFLAVAAVVAWPVSKTGAATITWTNAAGDLLWSTALNWDINAVPTSADIASFGDSAGYANVQGAINNIVGASTTVGAMRYDTPSIALVGSSHYHTLWIQPGMTLTVDPGLTVPLTSSTTLLGEVDLNITGGRKCYTTIIGTNASLVVGNMATPYAGTDNNGGWIDIWADSGTAGAQMATVDLSGLDDFKFGGGTIRLGSVPYGTSTSRLAARGTLILAKTNLLIAASVMANFNSGFSPGVWVGSRLGGLTGSADSGDLQLGVTNALWADLMMIGGGGGSSGTMHFQTGALASNPALTVRGTNGVVRLGTWGIGDAELQTSGAADVNSTTTGTVDLTGGKVDALVGTLSVGRNQPRTSTRRGGGNGTLTFTAGTIDATTLYLGSQAGAGDNGGSATGVLNVRTNASLIVNDFKIGGDAGANAGTGNGTLNIAYGGQVTVTNNIVENDGGVANGTSTINITNASLTIGGALTVDTLRFSGGTLRYLPGNTADFTGTGHTINIYAGGATIDTDINNVTLAGPIGNSGAGALTKAGSGTLTLLGANAYTGGTTIGAGTLALGSANNRLPVAGTLTFGTATPTAGTLDLGGVNQQVGGLAVAGGADASSQVIGNSSATANSTLTYSGGNSSFGGIIQDILGNGGRTVALTVSSGTLTLSGASTYTGGTTISAGTLALSGSGAVNNSPLISLSAGATFDVSALGSPYNLSSSTALSAGGTGTTVGTTAAAINGASGGTVNLGTQPITLTYDGVNPALYVSQGTLQAQGNVWTINGTALTAGTTYTIASQASGTVNLSGTHTVYGTAISGLTATITTDGGANLQLVTSAALTATTNTLSSSGDNNTYGLGPIFTATISDAGASGTVLFVIDGVPQLPAAAVSSGVATLTVNGLTVGTHTVVAQYGGDGTYGASVSSPLSQTVVRKALTLSGLLSVPGSKVYDGTTVATVSGTSTLQASEAFGTGLAGDGQPYTGDAVSLAGTPTGTYNSKDVATATTVTYGGLSLSGARSGNYTLTIQSPDPATITTKALTVSSPAVTTKLYDGGVTATPTGSLQTAEAGGTGTTGDGKPYTGDTLTLSATGTFDTRDVGTGKAVASTYTLGGAQATDYLLTQPTGLTGTINPTNLTVKAAADTKVYDGTTNSAATPTITTGAIQTGDSAPAWTETYDTKDVGTGKMLTPAGLVNDGNSGTNYTYTYIPVATGVINQTNITVTAETNTKAYDGTTNAAATPTVTSGSIQTGDLASFTETYDTPSVGTGKTLTPSGLVIDGNSGTNYAYTFISVSTGVITNACSQTNALLSITVNLDGTFKLTFMGTLQAEYYVLTQTNLAEPMANWGVVEGSTNTVTNLSGLWEFTVTNTTPQGFYRSAAVSPCP